MASSVAGARTSAHPAARSSRVARRDRRAHPSLDAEPGLRAVERADVAAQLELFAAFERLQAGAVDLAVVRVEHVAAGPGLLVFGVLLEVADDREADHRLVLALIGALVAL